MPAKVTFVELTVYERLLPLASGYLEAYARQDPELDAAFTFEKYSAPLKTVPEKVLADLLESRADVYAFSCYVWNTGIVKTLLPGLLRARPGVHVILGGPQVINHGERYLDPAHPNLVLCNGEGERIFSAYLRELASGSPDLSRVRGMSFYRDGELVTTEPGEKIMTLDEIPSPFLNGIFEKGKYTYAIFETNRGCPFRCAFCYWGLGESRVAKFDEERLRAELTWLSENGILGIFMADANWGMLKRDVDLSRHIVECKERTGSPYLIVINSAKNKPERLVEIAGIFQGAGIMTTQSIAVQSLDDEALSRVDRTNIKLDAYASAQEEMNRRGLASYVELIWPLPGETLASFRRGVDRLCAMRAQSFIPYPLQLLNNTKLSDRRDEFGFVTVNEPARGGGEAELVVGTREVTREDHREGLWFSFAVMVLYNARGLFCTAHYLHERGVSSYEELFDAFSRFCKERRRGDPVVDFYRDSLDDLTFSEAAHWGRVVHFCLHAHRAHCDAMLREFASSQPWWDREAEGVFEVDLLNKPYAYSNTPVRPSAGRFRHLRVEDVPGGHRVWIGDDLYERVRGIVEMQGGAREGGAPLRVAYKRRQMPYMKAQSLDHNASYCHAVMENIRSFVPLWSAEGAAASPPASIAA